MVLGSSLCCELSGLHRICSPYASSPCCLHLHRPPSAARCVDIPLWAPHPALDSARRLTYLLAGTDWTASDGPVVHSQLSFSSFRQLCRSGFQLIPTKISKTAKQQKSKNKKYTNAGDNPGQSFFNNTFLTPPAHNSQLTTTPATTNYNIHLTVKLHPPPFPFDIINHSPPVFTRSKPPAHFSPQQPYRPTPFIQSTLNVPSSLYLYN